MQNKKQIGSLLIIDDNNAILAALQILTKMIFKEVDILNNPSQIQSKLAEKRYNVILLDMNFKSSVNTGNEGLYWLKIIKELDQDVSVIMITAFGNIELAVNALKLGAVDFIIKPWDNHKLLATLGSALQLNLSKMEIKTLKEKQIILKKELNREEVNIIGESPQIKEVMNIVSKVAVTDANILITGENGVGKELIAREIHRLSKRKNEILVSVDMGAITETLFESELFGHVKGAFTDAIENKCGKFEAANNGSLFLDEIGNLSFHLQAKLLSALQNRIIYKVGSMQPIPVNIRLICATNMNLEQMVAENKFREDLLYRINTIQIEVPPLRERGKDIILLANYFLKKYSVKYNKGDVFLNENAENKLLAYKWPGNIRELQHTIEKAIILSDSPILKPDDFFLRSTQSSKFDNEQNLTIDNAEKQLIETTILKNKGNISVAAEQLGVSRQTLYNKIKKYDL